MDLFKYLPSNKVGKDGINWRLLIVVVLSMLLLLSALWGASKLESTSVLPVKSVSVKGNFKYVTQQQIQNLVVPYLNQGFLGLQTNKIQQRLGSLPWVKKAVVERVWPDKLAIKILEKQPLAIWEGGVLTVNGHVFYPGEALTPKSLPKFLAPDDMKQSLIQAYNQYTQLLAPLKLTITSLTLQMPENIWRVGLSNGAQVILGANDMLNRMKRFVTIYPKVFTGNKKGEARTIDMRYVNGFAVKWKSKGKAGKEGKKS